MNKPVKVVRDESGIVIVPSENNEKYGYIRVTQERTLIDETGWVRVKELSALVKGTIEDLKRLGWLEGQSLPGTIVIKEQLLPFNSKNPEKDLKIAGDTGIVCRKGDDPIYRNTFYSPSGKGEELIAHTNKDEIVAAKVEEEEIDEFQV